jgi:hypothetical protein
LIKFSVLLLRSNEKTVNKQKAFSKKKVLIAFSLTSK